MTTELFSYFFFLQETQQMFPLVVGLYTFDLNHSHHLVNSQLASGSVLFTWQS